MGIERDTIFIEKEWAAWDAADDVRGSAGVWLLKQN